MSTKSKKRNGTDRTSGDLTPDLQAAEHFLNALDPEANRFTFQTFPDSGDGKARILHGTLKENADELTRLNRSRHGIFCTVNETDLRGRRKSNIQRIRAVFADRDNEPTEPVLKCEKKPNLIVQTSPRNNHPYWFADGLELEKFKPIQKRIQERFNGDAVNDRSRVMRLPGFFHMKDPDNPHLVKVVHEGPDRRYTAEEIKDTFPPVKQQNSGAQKELNTDQESRGSVELSSGDSTNTDSNTEPIASGAPFILPDTIEEGTRNTTLTRYAGSIWTEEKTQSELLEDLKRVNQNRCKPPMERSELEGIARSAERNFDPIPERQSTGAKIQELLDAFPSIEWPDALNDSDKAVLRVLLDIAERSCSLTVTASSRQLSERSSYTRRTVLKALERLQQYGENGFIEKTSEADGQNAPHYRINRTPFHHYSNQCGRVRGSGEVLSGVCVEELTDTVYWPGALGRKARPIINVLRDTGGVESIRELADMADTTPRTVRRKLYGYDESDTENLTDRGIVEVEEVGRCKQVQLTDDWKENLKEYRRDAPTWLKDIDRKIRHREERIIHAYETEKRETGELELVYLARYGEVKLPSDVINYVKLERDFREGLNDADGEPEADHGTLDILSSLQSGFTDRVKRLANELLELIRERIKRESERIEDQREKWGLNND